MMSDHHIIFARLWGGVFVLALALGCGQSALAADVNANAEPMSGLPLMPGWQAHTRALFFHGPGPNAGYNVWDVPPTLEPGRYVVIARNGDQAELVEGHQFERSPGAQAQVQLLLPASYNNLEVLDEHYLAPTSRASKQVP